MRCVQAERRHSNVTCRLRAEREQPVDAASEFQLQAAADVIPVRSSEAHVSMHMGR